MGGKRRSASKSFFSMLCKLFTRPRYRDDEEDEPRHVGKVWASDEDRWHWVGEPDIDIKATEFIAKFHETRVTDPQTISV